MIVADFRNKRLVKFFETKFDLWLWTITINTTICGFGWYLPAERYRRTHSY